MEEEIKELKEAVNIFQEAIKDKAITKAGKEHTKQKPKNPRTKTSAQQSKKVFKLCREANGRTTARTSQTRKRQRTSSAREIPTSAMYQRPNSDLSSTEASREI